jgi:hypothetical protein
MSVGQHTSAADDLPKVTDRRGSIRPRRRANDAAIDRIVQRVGKLSEFSDAQIREIAAIALAAGSVDDAARQRRDEAARDNRSRLRMLGRD